MDKLAFFDLIFEQYDTKVSKSYLNNDSNKQRVKNRKLDNDTSVAAEFMRFFYTHDLIALFTNENRATPIQVRLPDAESVIKDGGKANKLLKDFAIWLNIAMDNKAYERAVYKILRESRTWSGFLKQIRDHLDYFPYIEENYKHNTWNIVYYDKDKSGTKVSKGI